MAKYKIKLDTDHMYMLASFWDAASFFEYFNRHERTKDGKEYKLLHPYLDYSYSRLLGRHRCLASSRNVQKCLSGDTLINLANGTVLPIKDLTNNKNLIMSFDIKNKEYIKTGAKVWSNGAKKVYEIELVDGNKIKTTINHPFYVNNQWKSIENGLQVGDYVSCFNHEIFGTRNDYHISFVKLIAYIISDGSCCVDNFGFTNSNPIILKEWEDCCKKNSIDCYYKKETWRTPGLRIRGMNVLRDFLKKEGLYNKKSGDKFIPLSIFKQEKTLIMEFINRLFACDGCITHSNKDNSKKINYSSKSEILIIQIKNILHRLGIFSFIKKQKIKDEYYYSLEIYDKKSMILFFENVGLIYGKEKQCLKMIENIFITKSWKKKKLRTCNFLHIKIKNIRYVGEEEVFDIEVPHYHNLISNNIITHNTTTLESETIQDGITCADLRTVYVVPAEKHMLEIADNLDKKFEKYPLLKLFYKDFNKKTRTVNFHTGHLIEFRIMGHDYTGEKSAIAQHPHKIVVDEAQLITKQYLQQLTAGGQKGFEYLIAGVPNNLRDTALWYGVSDRMFTYLRYAMYEGPNWSDDMKGMMLEQTGGENTEGWKTLVQGLWGERAYNVFPLGKLLVAKENFVKNHHIYSKQVFHDLGTSDIKMKLNFPAKDKKFMFYIIGIDVGGNSVNSPSELELWGIKEKNEQKCGVLVYKLSLYNIGTVIQAEVIDFIASFYDVKSIGIDAQAVGSDLYRNMVEGKVISDLSKVELYKKICRPFIMGSHIVIDKVMNEKTGKEEELKQPLKMKATVLLQDSLRAELIEIPNDTELFEAFQAETWQSNRQRIGGITYLNSKNEHAVDAARMYAMALWFLELDDQKTEVRRTIPSPVIRRLR